MRKIDKIIIHHSISPQNVAIEQCVTSFNKTHSKKSYSYACKSTGLYVNYHFVISGDGKKQRCRADSEVGYHAANLKVNRESIGICLVGDFNKEKPTEAQLKTVRELIREYKEKYDITEIGGHRDYAVRICPGKNMTQEMIDGFNEILLEKDSKYIKWSETAGFGEISPSLTEREATISNQLVKYLIKHFGIKETKEEDTEATT